MMDWKKRRPVIAGFLLFLLFMAVCTLIARGIYAAGLVRVVVTSPGQRTISHDIESFGTLRQGQEYGIYVPEGLLVATIAVQKGEMVNAGQPLLQVEPKELQSRIEEQEYLIRQLSGQQREQESGRTETGRENEVSLERAREDYERTLRDADLVLQRAREDLELAKGALSDHLENKGGAVSGSDAAASGEQWEADRTALAEKVREKERAVEDAILAREDSLLQADRMLEDAKEKAESKEEQKEAWELKQAEEALLELQRLARQGGWVCAGEGGQILDCYLQVGQRTPDTAGFLYAPKEGQRTVELLLSAEEGRYVNIGDSASLSFRTVSGAEQREEGRIAYLEKQEDGQTLARIDTDSEEGLIGQSVSVRISRTWDSYECCIPASALQGSDTDTYVYLIEEREGILGTEYHLRKQNVRVLDQNDRYVAIEGAGISQDTQILLSADREFVPGDAVRITGEESS